MYIVSDRWYGDEEYRVLNKTDCVDADPALGKIANKIKNRRLYLSPLYRPDCRMSFRFRCIRETINP